jgi:hypothetical protein
VQAGGDAPKQNQAGADGGGFVAQRATCAPHVGPSRPPNPRVLAAPTPPRPTLARAVLRRKAGMAPSSSQDGEAEAKKPGSKSIVQQVVVDDLCNLCRAGKLEEASALLDRAEEEKLNVNAASMKSAPHGVDSPPLPPSMRGRARRPPLGRSLPRCVRSRRHAADVRVRERQPRAGRDVDAGLWGGPEPAKQGRHDGAALGGGLQPPRRRQVPPRTRRQAHQDRRRWADSASAREQLCVFHPASIQRPLGGGRGASLPRSGLPRALTGEGRWIGHLRVCADGHSAVEAVFKVAEAEGGIENLKIEVLPGYQEEKERRKVADEARKLEKDRRVRSPPLVSPRVGNAALVHAQPRATRRSSSLSCRLRLVVPRAWPRVRGRVCRRVRLRRRRRGSSRTRRTRRPSPSTTGRRESVR